MTEAAFNAPAVCTAFTNGAVKVIDRGVTAHNRTITNVNPVGSHR